jgi:hypothetical protein
MPKDSSAKETVLEYKFDGTPTEDTYISLVDLIPDTWLGFERAILHANSQRFHDNSIAHAIVLETVNDYTGKGVLTFDDCQRLKENRCPFATHNDVEIPLETYDQRYLSAVTLKKSPCGISLYNIGIRREGHIDQLNSIPIAKQLIKNWLRQGYFLEEMAAMSRINIVVAGRDSVPENLISRTYSTEIIMVASNGQEILVDLIHNSGENVSLPKDLENIAKQLEQSHFKTIRTISF